VAALIVTRRTELQIHRAEGALEPGDIPELVELLSDGMEKHPQIENRTARARKARRGLEDSRCHHRVDVLSFRGRERTKIE
jgi:hypothetical protein